MSNEEPFIEFAFSESEDLPNDIPELNNPIPKTIVNSKPLDDTPFVAPYVPCTDYMVENALDFAKIRNNIDVLVDLGCGDGRILKAALSNNRLNKPKLCIGIELDPYLAEHARDNLGVSKLNKDKDNNNKIPSSIILEKDFFEIDFAHPSLNPKYNIPLDPTLMILYLLTAGLNKLKPLLKDFLLADPINNRIIVIVFEIPDWKPIEIRKSIGGYGMGGPGSGAFKELKLYTAASITD